MMALTTEDYSNEIRKNLDNDSLIIGTNRVLKEIKEGKIQKVYVTTNCPKKIKDDLDHYSTVEKFEIIELDVTNEELGNLCKKPFSISLLGLARG